MTETHEMLLVGAEPSGTEEWYCPSCDRRVLMRWPPDYQLLVLEPGDQTVAHAGGKGGMSIRRADVPDHPRPRPASAGAGDRQWLREVGIEWEDGADPAA